MPSTRTLATSRLPTDDGLQRDDVTIGRDQIVAILVATSPRGTCPVCGTWSETIHSQYQRTITDLPWGQQTVQLRLRVRKFFCRQPTCSRQIFTKRLPAVVAPYARRTRRLTEVVRLLAMTLGGEPGARIVKRLGKATSPATLLRLIRRTAVVSAPTPRVLGVDEAVLAAASLPYSNGQTEGQVNKLKVLKRQMYGRAKFDLLRLRLLHVACGTRLHQK